MNFSGFDRIDSGPKLGACFREHLLDVKNKGSDLSKPVARHFNLTGHSHEHMETQATNIPYHRDRGVRGGGAGGQGGHVLPPIFLKL